MPSKYYHRRVTVQEFNALMRAAGMRMNDFLFLTGRSIVALGKFLNEEGGFVPTMGDVLLLELAARDPTMLDRMTAIANEYSLGPQERPDEQRMKGATNHG